MYKNHFGFRERPFQLVPNPAYLFLSKSHEEALAHLNYATAQGDGFVEITGEVGTGKTTLCRAFIEGLDGQTEVAYIFNPKLDAVELLAAVHDEFGIECRGCGTAKALIDSLNAFLMAKKAQRRKVLLIIDEAQNLNREVLEQIRLLSNLETNTEKLLQIILVGQPELGEMLDSYELRQLGQRITLSAHLSPLSFSDTVRYVRHRLHIATQGAGVRFSHAAFRRIYKYSGGIPRLIHIVCDRALLVAYVLGRQQVNGRAVRTAIKELAGRGEWKQGVLKRRRIPMVLGALGCLAIPVFFALWHREMFLGHRALPVANSVIFTQPTADATDRQPEVVSPPARVPAAAPASAAQVLPQIATQQAAPQKLAPQQVAPERFPLVERQAALVTALSHWGVDAVVSPDIQATQSDPGYFQSAGEQNGFGVYRLEGDFHLLQALNLPAILAFYAPGANSLRYLTLSRIDEKGMVLSGTGGDDPIILDADALAARWSGVAYVPWRNFLDCRGTIPIAAPKKSVLVLKQLLKNIGYDDIGPGAKYGAGARAAVKKIQEKYGLRVDGLVGSLTKILLYNEQGTFDIPHLKNEIL